MMMTKPLTNCDLGIFHQFAQYRKSFVFIHILEMIKTDSKQIVIVPVDMDIHFDSVFFRFLDEDVEKFDLKNVQWNAYIYWNHFFSELAL